MADGTHLVIIDDVAEDNAVRALLVTDPSFPYYWMGITDAAAEGTWLTVLGGAPPYLGWAAGQPNGGTAQNNAVAATSDGAFYDYYGTQLAAFACECE